MRFTFYSAVSFAALLGQQTANAVNTQKEADVDVYAQLESRPVYEEDINFAQAAADALDQSDDEFDLAQINAEIRAYESDGALMAQTKADIEAKSDR